jgi:hypothetical protein
VEHLHSPRIAWFYDQTGDTNFTKGKIRLNIAPDGHTQDGGQQGIREHEDHVALYYALRRNADGMYNEKAGKYDGISAVYRIKMASAYVVDPDKPMDIPILAGDLWRKRVFEAIKANTIESIETKIPQGGPPGTGEAAYPGVETRAKDLPTRDFFLKTLDRPHYPDGVGMDNRGNPIDDQGNRIDSRGNRLDDQGHPIKPAQPQQQVNNDTPTALASARKP